MSWIPPPLTDAEPAPTITSGIPSASISATAGLLCTGTDPVERDHISVPFERIATTRPACVPNMISGLPSPFKSAIVGLEYRLLSLPNSVSAEGNPLWHGGSLGTPGLLRVGQSRTTRAYAGSEAINSMKPANPTSRSRSAR